MSDTRPSLAAYHARVRNWRVHQLRMIRKHVYHTFDPTHHTLLYNIIDAQLSELGADTHEQYRARLLAEPCS